MKCSICGREYQIFNLFCLGSGRGANAHCDEHCILLCEKCVVEFIEVYRTGIEELRRRYKDYSELLRILERHDRFLVFRRLQPL